MNFFITKNFSKKIDKKSNLILSPEFYWVKKISLDVRFTSEVKNMAESIFDGVLPKGSFEYRVFKLAKKEYIVVAYDLRYICKELKHLNIELNFINKIFLAQSELSSSKFSFFVDDNFGLTVEDGVVLYVPRELLEDSVDIEGVLRDKKISSKYIYSSKFSGAKFYDKWLNLFLLILVLCSFIFLADIFRLRYSINSIHKTKADVLKINSLPSSSFELKSLLGEFEHLEKKRIETKRSIDYISRFKLKKGEYFESLEIKEDKILCKVKFKNLKRVDEFKRYISKKRKSSLKVELKR